jgi:hypothetical protein
MEGMVHPTWLYCQGEIGVDTLVIELSWPKKGNREEETAKQHYICRKLSFRVELFYDPSLLFVSKWKIVVIYTDNCRFQVS